MFAVYTPQGRTFTGTLEALRKVEKPPAVAGSRRAAPAVAEDTLQTVLSDAVDYKVNTAAAQAYQAARQENGQREPVHHAYQAMSTQVRVLQSGWTLDRVGQAFATHAYQVFPIIDERKTVVGLLSRCDYYRYRLENMQGVDPMQITAAEAFLTPDARVYCADPVTDVRRIARLLVEKALPGVPIVEESGVLVGIVTRTDVLSCAIADPPLSLWA